MIKKSIFAGVLASLSIGALAQDYQTEVFGVAGNVDSGSTDTQYLGAGIKYHFKTVNTEGKPLAEADFLQRSSNVWASHTLTDTDYADKNATAAGGELYFPGTMFYVAGSVERVDEDDKDIENKWYATAGITPIDGLRVTTTYVDDHDYDLNLDAKYVFGIGAGQFLGLRGGYYNGDDHDTYSIGGDYFFTRATNVGLDMSYYDGDTTTKASVKHFFTPAFYAGAAFITNEWNDQIEVNAGFRF